MKYVCSKNYKILCKEDCYHVKNIKEENRVWFDTIEEGLEYGCRPCKHCMSEMVYGKWLPVYHNGRLTGGKCSICGKFKKTSAISHLRQCYKFCHNCGTKMGNK